MSPRGAHILCPSCGSPGSRHKSRDFVAAMSPLGMKRARTRMLCNIVTFGCVIYVLLKISARCGKGRGVLKVQLEASTPQHYTSEVLQDSSLYAWKVGTAMESALAYVQIGGTKLPVAHSLWNCCETATLIMNGQEC